MPQYISFFCVIPPKAGTGQTQVGNAAKVSEEIERLMPHLWKQMTEKTLTYTARYLLASIAKMINLLEAFISRSNLAVTQSLELEI